MGNRKIDQLPNFTGDTTGVHVVINNASNTTTHTVTKEVFLDGNNTFHGNQVVSGSLSVSGTTEFGGDLVPRTARGATLGTEERPFRDLYLQSASINIKSDIIGGRNALISNADGNVTIQAAGFQLKSGSFVAFEISEEGLTTIQAPKQILGTESALNIVGSLSGYQQPRNFSGSLIQLTAQDNQPARISLDSYGTNTYGLIAARSARGTVDIPTQTKSGDTLLRLTAQGWTNTNTFVGSISRINLEANDDFTATSAGTKISFQTTPKGSTTIQTSATIDPTGLFVSGALTASLTDGYFWVGGNNNRTTLISTSSFATTGSNTFVGNETISGSLYIQSGSAFPQSTGSSLVTYNQTTGQLAHANFASVLPSLVNYGQFSDLTTQSGSADTAYAMKLGNTDLASGFSIVSGSRITAANTGTYNLQFSAQLLQTTTHAPDVSIWLRKNGTNVPNSNTELTIEKVAGGGKLVAAWNFIVQLNANQYVELMWSSSRSDTRLHFNDVLSTPTRPATPSVIVTMTQIA